jgi:hypothetical protein
MSKDLSVIGKVYRFAMEKAGVEEPYSTTCSNPGFLIAPTQLRDATLYVLTSETSSETPIHFRDAMSGAEITVDILPGRGALLLVGKDGKVLASYNIRGKD